MPHAAMKTEVYGKNNPANSGAVRFAGFRKKSE